MLLERVEIVGFRGINRLSLMLEQNNVLIGENAWGKSSLLDALTLLLSPEFDLYHFVRDDFWFPPGDIQGREHHLHIILTFRETEPGRHRVRRFRPLQRCWVPCDDGYHRVFYRLEGELAEDDSVMTLRSFIDGEGESHAWVEAFIDGYWRGFDPTNGIMLEHQPYIKIAHGRDFMDCRLNRGVFIGKNQQNLYVNVTVARDEQ